MADTLTTSGGVSSTETPTWLQTLLNSAASVGASALNAAVNGSASANAQSNSQTGADSAANASRWNLSTFQWLALGALVAGLVYLVVTRK